MHLRLWHELNVLPCPPASPLPSKTVLLLPECFVCVQVGDSSTGGAGAKPKQDSETTSASGVAADDAHVHGKGSECGELLPPDVWESRYCGML